MCLIRFWAFFIFEHFFFIRIDRYPNLTDSEVERSRYAICQAHSHASNLLPQHLALGLDHFTVIRPHERFKWDEDRLPVSNSPRMQSVLVDVCGDYRLCLQIDKVSPSIRLDPHCKKSVHLKVP